MVLRLLQTISIILLLNAAVVAAEVPDAATVADHFLSFVNSSKAIVAMEPVEGARLAPDVPPVTVGTLFHLSGGGFVLVSSSMQLTPIKAYSLTADFRNLPPPVRDFILKEMEYHVRTLDAQGAVSPMALTPSRERWTFLLNYPDVRSAQAYTPGTHLLTTAWNQDAPYNDRLPEVNGTRVLAGCTNVAMGQLMRYHKHPAAGRGVAAYQWNGTPLKAVLYRPYNWDIMPDRVDAATPAYQRDAVALLMRDLGIANQTDFGVTGSGAAIQAGALVSYFGYADTLKTMDNLADAQAFYDTIRSEIDAERPVLLHFPGHITVADGYSSNPAGNEIHVNFGWGGGRRRLLFPRSDRHGRRLRVSTQPVDPL